MCPELIRQLETNVRAVNKDDIQDKPAKGQKQDIMDAAEYWAGSKPHYVFQKGPIREETPGMRAFLGEAARWDDMIGRTKSPDQPVVCGVP